MTARAACVIALFATCVFATTSFAQDTHTTNQFHGVKVNSGTVTHSKQDDRNTHARQVNAPGAGSTALFPPERTFRSEKLARGRQVQEADKIF